MSRIGKRPIQFKNSSVSYDGQTLHIKGVKGQLQMKINPSIEVSIADDIIVLRPVGDQKNPMLGTISSLIRGMIRGVTDGFQKQLNLVGVGYRASVSGKTLEMSLGFSHLVCYRLPDKVNASVIGNNTVVLSSIDKQLLGQVASEIRKYRPPEPYKGKGILFKDEVLIRKAGKSGKK